MVLILSDKNDLSTCEVINWLRYNKTPFTLLTETDTVQILEIYQDGHFAIKANGRIIESKKISGYWYRRGKLNLEKVSLNYKDEFEDFRELLKQSVNIEMRKILSYIHAALCKIKHIGGLYRSEINKLHVLDLCREIELKAPPSIVTTRKESLINFMKDNGPVITKAATSTIFSGNDNIHLAAYTEMVSESMVSKLPERFAPSFFQKRVDKQFEIRTVYLNGEFYSMAIFSQRNSQTQIDFRHYDRSNPNRRVPYKLPAPYADKLKVLLDRLKLNGCSVDTLVSEENEFYFLEVNPVGQFGMTSFPCNYSIESEIASSLS